MNYKIIGLLPFFVFSVSCSEFLRGRKQEEKVLKIQNAQFSCLNQIPETMRSLMDENSSPDSVVSSLECLIRSLNYFKSKTVGSHANRDSYTSDNLRSFFGDYIGDQNRISEGLALELMKLKRALFGGARSSLTKAELQEFIDFLESMKIEIGKLKPYWHIILAKKVNKVEFDQIEEANQSLKRSLLTLLSQTQIHQSDYAFEDFKNLMNEVDGFISRTDRNYRSKITSIVPLIESVKAILFGEQVDMTSPAHWKSAISMVTDLHRIYLLFNYQFKQAPFYSRQGLAISDKMLSGLISVVDRSWVLRSGEISFESVRKFFEQLENRNLLPDSLTAGTVFQTYRAVVIRILEREKKSPELSVTGMERKHLRVLKGEYEIWRMTQKFVNLVRDHSSYEEVMKDLAHFNEFRPEMFSDVSRDLLLSAWRDWVVHLSQKNSLTYLPTGDLVIGVESQKKLGWSWASLARLNVMRTLTRVLILGYGHYRTLDAQQEIIREEGMIRFYDDFAEIGLALKAFDQRKPNAGIRSFFEGDHFLLSSNGDDRIDMQEAFELVNVIFSAGLSGVDKVMETVKAAGCNLSENDEFGNPWNDEACFQQTLRSHAPRLFQNLPGLATFIQDMDDPTWENFYNATMTFARFDPAQVGRVETADVRTFIVILHYVEGLYVEFDRDRDQLLSKAELVQASDRFSLFFKKVFKLMPEPDDYSLKVIWKKGLSTLIDDGFACTVMVGKIPTISECIKALVVDALKVPRYSNRIDILQTLNAFKNFIQ